MTEGQDIVLWRRTQQFGELAADLARSTRDEYPHSSVPSAAPTTSGCPGTTGTSGQCPVQVSPGFPPEGTHLGRVDAITAVMAQTVRHIVDPVGACAGESQ